MNCLLRHNYIDLDLSYEFMMWATVWNFTHDDPFDFLCMGWEL